MSMTKEKIISYLQDPEIQEELRKVLQPEPPHAEQPISQSIQDKQPEHKEDDELNPLKALEELKQKLFGTEQALAREQQERGKKQEENRRLQQENASNQQKYQRLQQENANNQQKYQQDMSSLKSQAKQDVERLNGQLQALRQQAQQEQQALQGQIAQLQGEVGEKSSQIRGLEGELSWARGVISKFEAEQVSFRLYQSLSSSTKSELIRVFHQETFENFIACCAQKDTAEALWMFTKTRIFNDNMNEVSQLADIFRFSVACHNSTSESPSLHLVEGKAGDRFDSETHLGTPQSKKAGTVQTMHFAGYAVGRDKKIKQKAIVIVE